MEQSDRAPLLDWEEVPPPEPAPTVPSPQEENDLRSSPSNCRPVDNSTPGAGWITSPGAPTGVAAVTSRDSSSSSKQGGLGGDAESPEERDSTFPGLSVKDHTVTGWEEKDQIVAVFVVTFDTRSGGTEGKHLNKRGYGQLKQQV